MTALKERKIIETLKNYEVHPKVITPIANIYSQDSSTIRSGELNKDTNITRGIRQGCTGSITLFKVITFQIIEEIHKKNENMIKN